MFIAIPLIVLILSFLMIGFAGASEKEGGHKWLMWAMAIAGQVLCFCMFFVFDDSLQSAFWGAPKPGTFYERVQFQAGTFEFAFFGFAVALYGLFVVLTVIMPFIPDRYKYPSQT